MNSLLSIVFVLCGLFLVTPDAVLAHLKEDPGFSCFKMQNDRVVEIDNPLTVSPFASVEHIEAVPNWVTDFSFDQAMQFSVTYQVAHCRPFNIFIAPIYEHHEGIIPFTSPSQTYDPGERSGEHSAFVGFKRLTDRDNIDSVTLSGIKISIVEYGTSKVLAEREFAIQAAWYSQTPTTHDSEQCRDEMSWPPDIEPNRACHNATDFDQRSGFSVIDNIDLNNDGICELVVEVESCRKLNNNICYKLYAERDGYFQEIWQYYNTLLILEPEDGYHRLGSTETGPVQARHRLGRYDSGRLKYATERYLTPCLQ